MVVTHPRFSEPTDPEMTMLEQLKEVMRLTYLEAKEHPVFLAAIVMRPLGFEWREHRWVEKRR